MPVQYTPEGHIARVSAADVPDAKLTIKELKLKKKEYMAQKKEINAQMAEVRANARSHAARTAPSVRIPGTIGKISRGLNQMSRTSVRSATDNAIVQLEASKAGIEAHIVKIDHGVLQLEKWILEKMKA